MITPSYNEFLALANHHNVIPLRADIVVDRVTPVSVFERLQKDEPYAFLLESVEGGERFGRYSFVGQRPHAVFMCKGNSVTYSEGKTKRTWKTTNPFQELKKLFEFFHAIKYYNCFTMVYKGIHLNSGFILLFVALVIWDVVWKAMALWKAARNNQRGWFVAILLINSLGILPILYIQFFQTKQSSS